MYNIYVFFLFESQFNPQMHAITPITPDLKVIYKTFFMLNPTEHEIYPAHEH